MAASSRTNRSEIWPVDRQPAVALEFLDRRARSGSKAGRLDLAVAEIGKRALDGQHALGRRDQFGDRIVAAPAPRRRLAGFALDAVIARSSASLASGLIFRPAA